MSGLYFGNWAESGFSGMKEDFTPSRYDYDVGEVVRAGDEVVPDALEPNIIFAAYTYEDYSGSALVVFEQDGQLFEVNGSHCSCYGLSEADYSGGESSQWKPEETTADSILMRTRIIDTPYRYDDESGEFGPIDQAIRDAVLAWKESRA
jgi:hypothetical protein